MLATLSLRDFLLVPSLDLELGEGFTALTGETGAGKSILLTAMALALGARAPRGCVRIGANSAQIIAGFEVDETHPVMGVLAERGIACAPGEAILFRRVVRKGGATRAFINDQAVSAAFMAEAGILLADIHGQHEGQGLLNVGRHRALLDQFAGSERILQSVSATYFEWTAARKARASLEERVAKACADRDYIEHVLEELDKLAPEAGEAQKLALERASLQASERVAEAVNDAEKALSKSKAEASLASASRLLGRAQSMPSLSGAGAESDLAQRVRLASEALERALIETTEARAALGFAAAGCDYSTAALEASEARLFALRAAGRKHSVDPDGLAGYAEQLRQQLSEITNSSEALSAASAAEASAWKDYLATAEKLRAKRKAGARRLEKSVAGELGPLKLGKAKVRVRIEPRPECDAGPGGLDDIAFEICTNAGGEFGALNKIASGGELARVSLALSVCLADGSTCGTLVFDEADVGVGGAVAAAVGERLARLGEDRQVLAITHSPQVAAAASCQLKVAKADKRGRTETSVDILAPKARKEEIARMLAGSEVTREARAAAGRLLAGA